MKKKPAHPKTDKARAKQRTTKARGIKRLVDDYFVSVGGEQLGPMKITQLWDLFWEGRINDHDQYRTAGLTEWTPIPALYHSRGMPYVRPTVSKMQIVWRRLSRWLTTHLPQWANSKQNRWLWGRCSWCNGPLAPKFFSCKQNCGVFCRPCMGEMSSLRRESVGCPICGGDIWVAK